VEKINQNLELRKRYKETDGEGMSEDEVKRAKLLLERDERKKMKKEEIKATRKSSKTASGTKQVVDTIKEKDVSKSIDESTAEESKETEEMVDTPVETAKETDMTPEVKEPDKATLSKEELRALRKEQAKKLNKDNKRLRMIYAKTGGEGMDEKVVEKVKILLERDERKKRKRAEKEVPAQ
jgi:hypothetical protein